MALVVPPEGYRYVQPGPSQPYTTDSYDESTNGPPDHLTYNQWFHFFRGFPTNWKYNYRVDEGADNTISRLLLAPAATSLTTFWNELGRPVWSGTNPNRWNGRPQSVWGRFLMWARIVTGDVRNARITLTEADRAAIAAFQTTGSAARRRIEERLLAVSGSFPTAGAVSPNAWNDALRAAANLLLDNAGKTTLSLATLVYHPGYRHGRVRLTDLGVFPTKGTLPGYADISDAEVAAGRITAAQQLAAKKCLLAWLAWSGSPNPEVLTNRLEWAQANNPFRLSTYRSQPDTPGEEAEPDTGERTEYEPAGDYARDP